MIYIYGNVNTMTNKKLKNISNIGITLTVILLILTTSSSSVVANSNINTYETNVVGSDEGNVTALIVGGPGYFIIVSNPKNVTIIANITVNITSSIAGSAEYTHELSVSPNHSSIVCKIGGMPLCILGRISAEVFVDGNIISSRTGFLIFGLFVIFLT